MNSKATTNTADSRVMQVLRLSTAHIPPTIYPIDGTPHLEQHPGLVAYPTEQGWFMWVPDDPLETAHVDTGTAEEIPPEMLNIQLFARRLDCDYVEFDADNDRDLNLPFYNW